MARIAVETTEEIKRRFRVACAEDGEQMSAVVIRLVLAWLEQRDHGKAGAARRAR